MHYAVSGGPQCPMESRWVVPQVRRGSICSGPVGFPQIQNRFLKQLVRIPGVPGHTRSSELRSVIQLVLSTDASRAALTGLLTWGVCNPPRTREHRLQIQVTVKFINQDLA